MSFSAETLYGLLPSIIRLRDAEQGYPLRQFLAVLSQPARIIEEDVARLYANQFVETCDDWLLPYIGDLIGYRTIHHSVPRAASRRAEIANTIGYRRRKGTVAMLEQLAFDVTGWVAHAKEFFPILVTNQYMNHVRPLNHATPDLRNWPMLERVETAFDGISHTVDTGRIPIGEGRHNVRNLGLFLWRLTAYPVRQGIAGPLPGDARRYFFSPLSADSPLYNLALTETDIASVARPVNVPEPISRLTLRDHLADYYGRAVTIHTDGVPVPLGDIRACNLADAGGGAWAHAPLGVVAVDPVLGRIAFPPDRPAPSLVEVDYYYGFSADMGGGAYERSAGFADNLAPVRQISGGNPLQPDVTLSATGGAVEISDSGRYAGPLKIQVDQDRRIELRSADEHRATIVLGSDLDIEGSAELEVTLNGLLIIGARLVVPANATNRLRRLKISDCTLVPGLALATDGTPQSPAVESLSIEAENVIVEIERSILGPVRARPSTELYLLDTIVDAMDRTAPAIVDLDGVSAGPRLQAVDSTVIGKVHATAMPLISNSILDAELAPGDPWPAAVRAGRKQEGCVRFSYVPFNSRVPRRYRCQPSFAIETAVAAAKTANPTLSQAEEDTIAAEIVARIRPAYTDRRYGRPGYMQLLTALPRDIRAGSDDESEIGAFHKLYQPAREINLRTRLDEYLRVGLEVGLIFET